MVLALILTAIPLRLVYDGTFPRETTLIVIAIFAAIQILVHLCFFLHIDSNRRRARI